MREIFLNAEQLVATLLDLPPDYNLCLLDSGAARNLGSHLLIAGFLPIEILEINESDVEKTFAILDGKLARPKRAAILTLSYEFGLKINRIEPRAKEFNTLAEPDVVLAVFDFFVVHDYKSGKTFLVGNEKRFSEIERILLESKPKISPIEAAGFSGESNVKSNFTRREYLAAVERIQEKIRDGDTYQTNLTQQLTAELPKDLTPEWIFSVLRQNHPAAFSAFLRRPNDAVVSVSPERFFKVQDGEISVSPIKGTRPRGKNESEDLRLQNELMMSEKDLAENAMIVDLLRNDIGRVCEYGSVAVEKLCELETHPTLFHLVSTVSGRLRENIGLSDILRAAFPCGSITGAPKISTMRIIDELETAPRGLSMGAVGYVGFDGMMDFSVAIRTMTVRERKAVFNVGGGIVIDSNTAQEYEETLVKAQALLKAINGKLQIHE